METFRNVDLLSKYNEVIPCLRWISPEDTQNIKLRKNYFQQTQFLNMFATDEKKGPNV